jgi:hypothetical protein
LLVVVGWLLVSVLVVVVVYGGVTEYARCIPCWVWEVFCSYCLCFRMSDELSSSMDESDGSGNMSDGADMVCGQFRDITPNNRNIIEQ